jgi:hypothetical protein
MSDKVTDMLIALSESAPANGRIIRYFPNVHMCYSHDGLREIAKKQKIILNQLDAGEFCVFMNRAQSACKIFGPGNTFCYFRMPDNSRINPKIIPLIPSFLTGGRLQYTAALDKVIRKEFVEK